MNENEQYTPSQDLLSAEFKEQLANLIKSSPISDYRKWEIVSLFFSQLEPLANKQIQAEVTEYREEMAKKEKKETPIKEITKKKEVDKKDDK